MKLLRERLQCYGPQTLLTEELLAVLLSTGSGRGDTLELGVRLLAKYGELGKLTQADRRELRHAFGLSEARALLFQVVLELSKRLSLPQTEERYQVISPANAARLVMPEMAYLDYEQLRATEIFRPVIIRNCPGIIVCHNLPPGSPEPSTEDLEANKHLVSAGQVLDIKLVDILIIGYQQFVSLKERLRW